MVDSSIMVEITDDEIDMLFRAADTIDQLKARVKKLEEENDNLKEQLNKQHFRKPVVQQESGDVKKKKKSYENNDWKE